MARSGEVRGSAPFGGDEFAVLYHAVSSRTPEEIIARIDAEAAAFNRTGTVPYVRSMSMGCVQDRGASSNCWRMPTSACTRKKEQGRPGKQI